MLRLAAVNLAGAVLFASIYALAGTRALAQSAFVVALVVFFVGLTAVWVRVERAGRAHRDPLSRLGRGAAALLLVVIGLPGVVLVPLFSLHEALPAEADVHLVIRPAMVLLLVSLGLVAVMNLAGLGTLAVTALWRRRAGRSRRRS